MEAQMTEGNDAGYGDTTFVRSKPLQPTPPGINYWCKKCDLPIRNYEAMVRPDGKLDLTGWCHGASFTVTLYLGIGGWRFNDGVYEDRDNPPPLVRPVC